MDCRFRIKACWHLVKMQQISRCFIIGNKILMYVNEALKLVNYAENIVRLYKLSGAFFKYKIFLLLTQEDEIELLCFINIY